MADSARARGSSVAVPACAGAGRGNELPSLSTMLLLSASSVAVGLPIAMSSMFFVISLIW